jgi:hypothetical protein
MTTEEERRIHGNIVAQIIGRPDLIEPSPRGSPLGASQPLDSIPVQQDRICIFCHHCTAVKRGITNLTDGTQQQKWYCRNCGKSWQIDREGNIVDPERRKVKL